MRTPVCLLLLALTGPALAAEPAPLTDQAALATPAEKLDNLFAALKRERVEKAAERIAGRISEQWFHSGSASIDLMMLWSQQAMEAKKFDVALDFSTRS